MPIAVFISALDSEFNAVYQNLIDPQEKDYKCTAFKLVKFTETTGYFNDVQKIVHTVSAHSL